jgi:hypothetical protein
VRHACHPNGGDRQKKLAGRAKVMAGLPLRAAARFGGRRGPVRRAEDRPWSRDRTQGEHRRAQRPDPCQERPDRRGGGSDLVSLTDHYHPWNRIEGQSPFAWTVLGGIAAVTDRVSVSPGITRPDDPLSPGDRD